MSGSRWRWSLAALLSLLCATITANEPQDPWDSEFSGHFKYQFIAAHYPEDSLFRTLTGSSSIDNNSELRLKFSANRGRWDVQADYQFIAVYSDTLEMGRLFPGSGVPANSVINDDRRWFDLTHTIENDGKTAVVQRLDRLSVGFTTDNTAWRFGRQAISWGNGMLFSPMDIFNPFEPAAVDKEYKTGDDMLYGQILFGDGSDLQGVGIVRRDPISGDVESSQSSLALKYHGFAGMNEYDLLFAEHYDDRILGIGGSVNAGGAVVRGDLTWTDTADDSVFSGVASVSYSWVMGGKNVSGIAEYYYNGFGQSGGRYSPEDLLNNPALVQRLARGELFTLARHYVALSASVEWTPLLMLIPNFFVNLEDPSTLAQLVAQYNWQQNLLLLAALNVPIGSSGSEYGGIDAGIDGLYLSTGPSLFAQIAWYF